MKLATAALTLLIHQIVGSVILDLLKIKHINNVAILDCDYNNMLNQKLIMNFGVRTVNIKNNYKVENRKLYFKTAFVLDTTCDNWTNILDNYDFRYKFKTPESWFFITRNITSTVNALALFPAEVDSDFTIILQTDDSYYKLYEFYNSGFNTSGSIFVTNIGYWNESLKYMPSKRVDLSGVVLKCMAVVTHPSPFYETIEHYLDTSPPTPVDNLNKLKYFIMLKYFRDMYKFNYKLYRTNSWGYLHNSTIFDGMVGALQRHEMDIGGSPVLMRKDRQMYIDYTAQVWDTKQSFIFRHPKRFGAFYTVFTRPLEDGVWYCTLAFIIVAIVTLHLMLKLKLRTSSADDPDTSFSVIALYILGAICQQGSYVNRCSISVRIVTFIIFIFSLNLYQYYNASIVSTLLQEPPKNIRSLEDLLNSPLRAGVENVLYVLDYFGRTTDPNAIEIYNRKIVTHNDRNVLSPPEGMALVKKGGYAFHVDSSVGYKIIRETFNERETCELQEVPLFPPMKMVSVVTQGSPYKELLARGVRKMAETGIMRRIQKTWDEPKPKCTNTPDTTVFNVNLRDFSMALVVLGVGMAMGLLTMILEIIIVKYYDKRAEIPFRI